MKEEIKMHVFEAIRIIGRYNLGEEISLYADGSRITGILIDYDDDCVKIKSDYDKKLIVVDYSDIEDI